jgi:Demerecviridae HNH endonuclease
VPKLSWKRLREALHYDLKIGQWTNLINRGSRARAGTRAGTIGRFICREGGHTCWRRFIGIDGKHYLASRLAWFYMTKKWPTHEIDHISTDTLDDSWANLRHATSSENRRNRRPRKDNRTGLKGVIKLSSGKYRAQIGGQGDGRNTVLGRFATAAEAHAAYVEAAKQRFGHFARSE